MKTMKGYLASIAAVISALFLSVPSAVFAAEDTGAVAGPTMDSTDVKIIDSMPIIYSDSELNAALEVLDMSSGSAVDLNGSTVPSGTILTYVIAYRNDNAVTETVHLQIPVLEDFPLRSASNQGAYEGTLVNWDNVTVEPGDTVTRYITCDTPHATELLPSTGLVMISSGDTLETNTVQVAVSAPVIADEPEAPEEPAAEQGVLGAVRRALRAASDSPAVLGMRRAIQTGDVPYIALCVALLAAFCTMFAAVIVIIAGKRRSGKEEN